MKHTSLLLFICLFFSCNNTAQNKNSSQNDNFYLDSSLDKDYKHEWYVERNKNEVIFKSAKPAPIPFSMTGEPQAIMYFAAFELDALSEKDLQKIVEKEVLEIKNTIRIIEYFEEDYPAKENIVVYFEKYKNTQLAVIKFRTNGEIEDNQIGATTSIRHILFVVNDKFYISTLTVLYAEYQDDIRSDQMTFIKTIIDRNK